jgi:hypothetical protein
MISAGDSGWVNLDALPDAAPDATDTTVAADLPPDGPAITITLIGAEERCEVVANISLLSENTIISSELCSELKLVPMVLAESKKKYSAEGYDGKVIEGFATARMLRLEIGGHRFAIRPVLVVKDMPHPSIRIQLGRDFMRMITGELRVNMPHGYVNITADGEHGLPGDDGPRVLRFKTETGEAGVIDLRPERLDRVQASIARLTAHVEAKKDTCAQCGVRAEGLKACARCKQVRFCGQQCQLENWPSHKADCKRWSVEMTTGKGSE